MADALHLPLSGQEAPDAQLLGYLQNKQMLLLLDDFEPLLKPAPEAVIEPADLLASILLSAPDVTLIVTSREVLNLQEEWLYSIEGLPYPVDDAAENLEDYGAVKLFAERARRVRRHFSLGEECSEVVRICQLVEGMPLGLELAASWTKTMPCRIIANEIQRNIDFLETGLRNVPSRQRSIRVIFDQSWKLLTHQERDVFKRLSVFRGGFKREAAERVAGASLVVLSALVDKSLLRWGTEGRYQIHELLRQYAAEQLVQSPEDVAHIYDAYAAYYTNFLAGWKLDITGGQQKKAAREIAADLENIRAAWQWTIQQARIEAIKKAALKSSTIPT